MGQKTDRLGILAGRGDLPYIAARRAQEAGEDVRIFYFSQEEPPSDLAVLSHRVVITQMFHSVIKSMKREGVGRLLLLGKASRDILFNNPRFDVKTLYLLSKMRNQSDYTIFESFAREFEKNSIRIIPQDTYLKEMFLAPGRYGKKCTKEELENVEFGMFYAREINRLDIGQTVVVGKKSVLAVEGSEGTDLCIQRGGELFRKSGAIVCKVAKANHDFRFDMPVTGFSTLESMEKGSCRILAIEAARTFVLNPAAFVKRARELGITILAVNPEEAAQERLKELNRKEGKVHEKK